MLRALREEVQQVLGGIGDGITDLDRRAAELLPLWRRLIVAAKGVYDEVARAETGLTSTAWNNGRTKCCSDRKCGAPATRVQAGAGRRVSRYQPAAMADHPRPGGPRGAGTTVHRRRPAPKHLRFRGADVGNFEKALEEVRDAGGMRVTLSQSFRSHQPLLDVLNRIHDVALPDSRHEPMVSERRRAPETIPPWNSR